MAIVHATSAAAQTTEDPASTKLGRHAVTINLSASAYEFFNQQAADDDRSLAKFLARKLQRQFEQEAASITLPRTAGSTTFRG